MTVSTGYAVWFTDDAAGFLERAEQRLAQEPITATVVTTIAHRAAAQQAEGDYRPRAPYDWFATVTDHAGGVVGVAMRTAPFAPYPPYLLEMPDDAAAALARAVLDRGEEVGGVAGALPAAEVFAAEVARATGRRVERDMHYRLFRLAELVEPRHPGGRLRRPRAEEAPLLLEWYRLFHHDADVQAGRDPRNAARSGDATLEDVRQWMAQGRWWVWVDDEDRPVNLTGANPPAYGVSRIGPVYTPAQLRGHGYASAAVAAVTRALLDGGAREVALFTDQANPTSNQIYPALGYVPVVDTVELLLV